MVGLTNPPRGPPPRAGNHVVAWVPWGACSSAQSTSDLARLHESSGISTQFARKAFLRPRRRKTVNTIGVCYRILCALVCLLALPSLGKAAGTCGFEHEMAAHDWLSARAAAKRPAVGYADLAPLPKALAASVLHRLPPHQQAAIWRERLAARATEVHPDQQGAIIESAGLITADLFARAARKGGNAVRGEIDLIVDTLSRSLGPGDVATTLSIGTMARPSNAGILEKTDPPNCNCYDSSECHGFMSCIENEEVAPCETQNWGCGYFFLFSCKGLCCYWMSLPGGGHWVC
jgi:hypothetical protein